MVVQKSVGADAKALRVQASAQAISDTSEALRDPSVVL